MSYNVHKAIVEIVPAPNKAYTALIDEACFVLELNDLPFVNTRLE